MNKKFIKNNNMDNIKINNQILNNIKKIVDREINNDKKNIGFSQLTNWLATEHITKGQMQKIISFYENYKGGDEDERIKKKIYDEINILPFCKNNVEHLKRLDKTKRNVHGYTSTNRSVDRMNKPSIVSIRPSKIGINEEIGRIIKIIRYIG